MQLRPLGRKLNGWTMKQTRRPVSVRSTVRRYVLHAVLATIPATCFLGTLVCDIVYTQSAANLWADMSVWLLTVGAIIFAITLVIDLISGTRHRRGRTAGTPWTHIGANLTVLIIAIFDVLIHTRDAYTSVVPAGVGLSSLLFLAVLLSGWSGWRLFDAQLVMPREAV